MSAELVYRIRPEGAAELQKIVDSVKASDEAVKRASTGLKDYDAASERAAKASEKYIVTLERQAAMAGKSARAQLDLKQAFDTTDFARTAADAERISVAYQKMHDAQDKAAASGTGMAASLGLSVKLFDEGIELAKSFARGLWDVAAGTAALAEQQGNTGARTGLTINAGAAVAVASGVPDGAAGRALLQRRRRRVRRMPGLAAERQAAAHRGFCRSVTQAPSNLVPLPGRLATLAIQDPPKRLAVTQPAALFEKRRCLHGRDLFGNRHDDELVDAGAVLLAELFQRRLERGGQPQRIGADFRGHVGILLRISRGRSRSMPNRLGMAA